MFYAHTFLSRFQDVIQRKVFGSSFRFWTVHTDFGLDLYWYLWLTGESVAQAAACPVIAGWCFDPWILLFCLFSQVNVYSRLSAFILFSSRQFLCLNEKYYKVIIYELELCWVYQHSSVDRNLWQKLFNACHALMGCCHGSMTQQVLVRWLVCPVGAGDIKPPPTVKIEHWAMWIIQLSGSGGRKDGYHFSMLTDLGRLY